MTTTQPSQAVAKRSLDTALMPPPPPPKRIKRPTTVLEEDEYTRGLSHIIARDFFPGLLETEAQEEYLDALESKDREWINDAGMRMREAMTPRRDGQKGRRGTSMTPSTDRGATFRTPRNWEGDTPVSVAGTDASREEDQKPKVDLSLSLTAFQAKYTSEDNESFNTSLDKQNTKRAEKYSWLYNGNQIPTARQIAWRNRDAKLLEDTRRERTNHDRENRNMHAIDDHPSASSATALTTRASRPAMPLHRPSAPRNGLMFIPADLPSSIPSRAETAAAASNAPPKSVSHASTRFAAPVDPNQETVPPSPSLSAIDDAIRGRPRDATDSEAGYSGAETPRVAGWAFVDAEPTEAELRVARGEVALREESKKGGGEGEEQEEEEEEEEGGLELLRKLHGGEKEEGKNPFTIHTTSKREDLHHRIVEKQNAQKRSAGMGGRLAEVLGGKTPGGLMPGATPRFASAAGVKGRAQGALTPAGERLLRTVGTPKREGLFGGERKKGETSNAWTPTPRVRKKAAG